MRQNHLVTYSRQCRWNAAGPYYLPHDHKWSREWLIQKTSASFKNFTASWQKLLYRSEEKITLVFSVLCNHLLSTHSEVLYEDETFRSRAFAALVASKVFYHLGAFEESLNYALGAGELFNVTDDSEYVETIIGEWSIKNMWLTLLYLILQYVVYHASVWNK